MTHLIRKQVYLEKRQDQWLKRQAKARHTSEAELIREALDQQAQRPALPAFQPAPDAWAELLEMMAARRALGVTGAAARFNREELYEERENRWVKG